MAALIAAFAVGSLVGLFARPLLDAYLNWKRAMFWHNSPAAQVNAASSPVVMADELDRD